MPRVEHLDWLSIEEPYNGCRIAGCINEAKNFYRGDRYCAQHAREFRDGAVSFTESHVRPQPNIYLYVFEAPAVQLLKFGRSENPKRRFQQVLDGSPIDITMLGFCLDPEKGRTEAWIHAFLHEHRSKGEWFRDHPDCRMIAGMIVENQPTELVKFARK